MTTIETTMRLGDVVTAYPSLARELERLDLDYCCGGQKTLHDACVEVGLDASAVADALERKAGPRSEAGWAALHVDQLADHIEGVHHRYLWDEMPRLSALVDKINGVHGERHPELAEVQRVYEEVRADLEPHMQKEERVLFPAIRVLAHASHRPDFRFGTVANPISVMLGEHDRVGELLARLRELTNGYTPPADGCASYRAAYEGLAELESDTHLHIHKENNVLFPAVSRIERDLRPEAAS